MKIALYKTSLKENEKRLPVYPEHFQFLPPILTNSLHLESNYGQDFGYTDSDLSSYCVSFLPREELFIECDILILPKPTITDLLKMREDQILCGWAHCVQQHDITQVAIDKKITVIAWESMNFWSDSNEKIFHIFYRNNELAGYAAVLHVLQLMGIDGYYGERKKVSILSYGSVSRGAIYALQKRGFNNIHVFSRRPPHLVYDQIPDVYFYHLTKNEGDYWISPPMGKRTKLMDELTTSDIIINGILQDPTKPEIFISNNQINLLKRNTIIIDISCDLGMGFEFAKPTSFDSPIIKLNNNVTYYSVDHTPSYLWNAASREISKALIPFLIKLVTNKVDYSMDKTLKKAVDIEQGIIRNKSIIDFQGRKNTYPYNYRMK